MLILAILSEQSADLFSNTTFDLIRSVISRKKQLSYINKLKVTFSARTKIVIVINKELHLRWKVYLKPYMKYWCLSHLLPLYLLSLLSFCSQTKSKFLSGVLTILPLRWSAAAPQSEPPDWSALPAALCHSCHSRAENASATSEERERDRLQPWPLTFQP